MSLDDEHEPLDAAGDLAPAENGSRELALLETRERKAAPCILYGIALEDYRADRLGDGGGPSLSASLAKILCSATPADAALAHPRLKALVPMLRTAEIMVRGESLEEAEESTDAQSRGERIHALVLGKGKDFAIYEAKDWRKKEAKEFKAAALSMGLLPVLRHVYDAEAYAAKTIHHRLYERYGLVLDGESELAIQWTETANDGTTVRCKGMLDHLCKNGLALDLKIIDQASPEACEAQSSRFNFSVQWAAYESGLRAIMPNRSHEFGFAFAEPAGAYVVQMARLNGEDRDFGQRRWRYAINKFAQCLNSGRWPAEYEPGARDGGEGWITLAPRTHAVTAWEEIIAGGPNG